LSFRVALGFGVMHVTQGVSWWLSIVI